MKSLRIPGRVAWVVLLSLFLSACDEDENALVALEKPDELWIPQDLVESQYFNQMIFTGDALYMAAGRDGAFMQAPAFFGEWKSLGLAFPEWSDRRPTGYGVSEVFSFQGSLHALIVSPGDDQRRPIVRFNIADSTWNVVETGLGTDSGTAAWVTGTGSLLVGLLNANSGLIRYEERWDTVLEHSFLGFQFAELGDAILYGAGILTGDATILRSTDDGRSWAAPELRGFPYSGSFTSLFSCQVPTPRFYFTLGHLYQTLDAGDSVSVVRTFPATPWLVANAHSPELIVAADSLYYSPDAGNTWTSWPSPNGGFLSSWVVDWNRRYIPVVEKIDGVGKLYCFNLDLALRQLAP